MTKSKKINIRSIVITPTTTQPQYNLNTLFGLDTKITIHITPPTTTETQRKHSWASNLHLLTTTTYNVTSNNKQGQNKNIYNNKNNKQQEQKNQQQ